MHVRSGHHVAVPALFGLFLPNRENAGKNRCRAEESMRLIADKPFSISHLRIRSRRAYQGIFGRLQRTKSGWQRMAGRRK
jgi:hypothetical protein